MYTKCCFNDFSLLLKVTFFYKCCNGRRMALGGELVGWEWASRLLRAQSTPSQGVKSAHPLSAEGSSSSNKVVLGAKDRARRTCSRYLFMNRAQPHRPRTQCPPTRPPANPPAWPPPSNPRTSRVFFFYLVFSLVMHCIMSASSSLKIDFHVLFSLCFWQLAGSRLVRRRQIRLLIPHRKRAKAATIERGDSCGPMTMVFQPSKRAFLFSIQHPSIICIHSHICSILTN